MKAVFAGTLLLFGLVLVVPQNPSCPEFTIKLPPRIVSETETIEISLLTSDGKQLPKDARIHWKVSGGRIRTGDGTPKITFAATSQDGGTNITISAAVEIPGERCRAFITDMFSVEPDPPLDVSDQFGKTSRLELRDRLDNLFIAINQNPGWELILMMHFPPNATGAYRRAQINRVLKIIRYRRYDLRRVSFYFVDDDAQFTEFTDAWIILPGFDLKRIKIDEPKLIKGEDISKVLKRLFL